MMQSTSIYYCAEYKNCKANTDIWEEKSVRSYV